MNTADMLDTLNVYHYKASRFIDHLLATGEHSMADWFQAHRSRLTAAISYLEERQERQERDEYKRAQALSPLMHSDDILDLE